MFEIAILLAYWLLGGGKKTQGTDTTAGK